MLHPIYSTVLGHPELIADHLANYAALLREEAREASRSLIARTVAGVLAVVSVMLALGLIGVAIMLGAMHDRFHWTLVAVPAVAMLVALVSALYAARQRDVPGFAELRAQVEADILALHLAGERHER
ncbi:Putative Holin-X, holin superfamily III [Variovorax sp. HW608]|uniref:phage holin family protein n=1 Tax=Variovorax sp. HW608 TaxID=1034889 RepID=UPI00081F9B07|nr:phage holin family protein [Variovorax sp. HW608]SCK45471.1 Putative Holin-X, holin superfamily III [Variovorax sp. HW608]